MKANQVGAMQSALEWRSCGGNSNSTPLAGLGRASLEPNSLKREAGHWARGLTAGRRVRCRSVELDNSIMQSQAHKLAPLFARPKFVEPHGLEWERAKNVLFGAANQRVHACVVGGSISPAGAL